MAAAETSMDTNRDSQKRRKTRIADHPERTRITHVQHEPAWANAWPHLDDWFKIYANMSRMSIII